MKIGLWLLFGLTVPLLGWGILVTSILPIEQWSGVFGFLVLIAVLFAPPLLASRWLFVVLNLGGRIRDA